LEQTTRESEKKRTQILFFGTGRDLGDALLEDLVIFPQKVVIIERNVSLKPFYYFFLRFVDQM